MDRLIALSRLLDAPSRLIGRWLRWLALLLVLVQLAVVVWRFVFASSHVMLQEAVLYTNAVLFMATVGYAYLVDGHVRVDIAYLSAPPRRKALIDLLGIVFMVLPFAAVMLWFGWPYVRTSWAGLEGALFFGGIPAAFLLKTLILVFPLLLVVQSLAIALRAIAVLAGRDVAVFEAGELGPTS